MTPLVTVLIGAFNNQDTLERAARSMLEQSIERLELVIVDDGSRDATATIAAGIAAQDARARVLTMPSNVGIARSLNAGLQSARAPIVAVLDADDWSERRRLERQLGVLETKPEIAVVGCRMREVDEQGHELVPRTSWAGGDVTDLLMRFNPIPNSAALFRREAARSIGGYDPRYRWAAEYDLWLRISEHHRVFVIEETLASRQMSPRNVAATREREQIAEAVVIRLRAMRRRGTVRGVSRLAPYVLSYVTPVRLKRARRRRLGQAP